jgi:hypothetical protein
MGRESLVTDLGTIGLTIKSGRGDWIRTNDHLLPKQIRYQAALHPEQIMRHIFKAI